MDEAGLITSSVMHLYKTAEKLNLSRTAYSALKNGVAFGRPGNAREQKHVLKQLLERTLDNGNDIIELKYDE